MAEALPRYRLGPRSRRGLVAGWRGGQIVVVAVGLGIAVLILRSVGASAGAFLAFGVVGVFVAFAAWPVAGRSPEQWTPVVARYLVRRLGVGLKRRDALSGLELADVADAASGRQIGVVVDDVAHTWTAAMRVGGSGFALGDEVERSRRIAAWSGVLASSAREGGALHRLQWVVRCLPGGLEGLCSGGLSDRGIAARSYEALLERAAPVLWRHDVLVALSVRAEAAPGGRRSAEASRRIIDEVNALERRCLAAGLDVETILSRPELAAAIRDTATVSPGEPAGESRPFPLEIEEGWATIRTDASWHAVYWVADWPRSSVGTGFLLPLMLEGGLRRTIAVTMAPVAPLRAVRRAEHDRTSGVADAELRRRHGFAVTARARNEHEASTRRENELAEGHGAFRFTGYLSVSTGDEAGLEPACARLEQIAAQSQLELHRMYGAQQDGYSRVLPTGRGCA